MPAILLERVPLPSLRTYTAVSVVLFAMSLYYAIHVTSHTQFPMDSGPSMPEMKPDTEPLGSIKVMLNEVFVKRLIPKRLLQLGYALCQETICTWILVNMVYCTMILIGKCIQKFVFGNFHETEEQNMKDKFWNFVFYKFIFVFGVMNVQFMDEVVIWCGWFSFVGAFHILSKLCRDRFEYLSFSPTTSKWTHIRLFALLFAVLSISTSFCTIVALYTNVNTFLFMTAEWMLVILRTLYVITRYSIHLYDITREGIWEKRGAYIYYSEFLFTMASLVVELLHHVHMLVWRNIFFSVSSLVICMQLRFLFNEIQNKIHRYKNYLRVSRYMEINYPLASQEELDSNSDYCAICWDNMEAARKLPCGHMFHMSCLHSWLEQVTTCPTCRTPLVQKAQPGDSNRNHGQEERAPRNHFFHFDGSRYVSWFPSFSVEVTHTTLLGDRQPPINMQTSILLDTMAHQVIQMFPHMPYNLVLEDLVTTHSVEQTVENILEERLVAPQTAQFPPAPPPRAQNTGFAAAGASSSNLFEMRSSAQNSSSANQGSSQPTSEPSTSTASSSFSSVDQPSASITGGRFSKNSQEREEMLSSRKEELIQRARNKYISKVIVSNDGSAESSSESNL